MNGSLIGRFNPETGALLNQDAAASDSALTAGASGMLTLCAFGDSITQYGVFCGQQLVAYTLGGTIGGNGTWLWAEWETPPGAGTVTFLNGSLRWAAFGEAAGEPQDATKDGILYLPAAVAGHGLWVVWFGKSNPGTNGTSAVTVQPLGYQVWNAPGQSGSYMAEAQGYSGHALKLAPMPATYPPGMDGCVGMGGASIQSMLNAEWQWSGVRADVAVVQIGTNENWTLAAAATTFAAKAQAFCAKLLAQGFKLVIWCTTLPRNADSVADRARRARAAQMMADYAATMGGAVEIFDAALYVTDPATGNWVSAPVAYSNDGIHPNNAGAQAIGKALGPRLAALGKSGLVRASFGDYFEATYNPFGNVVPSGSSTMAGTAGTLGTGGAGVVATGWRVERVTGDITATGSKVARTDGTPGEWQRVTLSGATVASVARLILASSITTGFVVGAKYEFEVEMRLVSSTGLNHVGTKLNVDGASGGKIAQTGNTANGAQAANDLLSDGTIFWRKTPAGFITTAVSTNLQPEIRIGTAAGGAAVVDVGRVKVRRVA